jgi:hypothetical protein
MNKNLNIKKVSTSRIIEIFTKHPFHILDNSLLPFFVSLSLCILLFGIVGILHPENIPSFLIPLL